MTQGRDFATCPPSAPPCSTRRLASWPAACTTRRRRAPEAPDGDKPLHDWYRTRNDQAGRLDLAVAGKAGGGCAGEAVLNQWDPGNDSRNFRILIGPDGRDRGLGTEATRLIVGYGFERLGLHRVSLEVYAFNPRARRAYEKAGFRAEGILASPSATTASGPTPRSRPSPPANGATGRPGAKIVDRCTCHSAMPSS